MPSPRSSASPSDSTFAQVAAAVEAADVALGEKLAGHRHEAATKAADKVGKAGDQEPLYALAAGLIALGLLMWNRKLARAGVATMAAVGAADGLKRTVKAGVTRTRPHVLLDEDRYEREPGGSDSKPEQSFPSGHVACTVAAMRAVGRRYPRVAPWAALAATVIGVSRIAKGAHWPLDVLAGAVIGFFAEAVTQPVVRSITHD